MAKRSKRKRRQQAQARKQQAAKTATVNESWPFALTANLNQDATDLTRTKWGAAMAYAQVHQINICVTILVNAIAGLKWNIRHFGLGASDEGDIIASSVDQFPKHPFVRALRNFRIENGLSLLATIMFDRTLYGEVFLEKSLEIEDNHFSVKSIDWLNPLGVSVEYDNTGVTHFRYGWAQQYISLPANKVAYLHTRDPFNDFVGYSRVMAVMAKINVERNMDNFLRDFFANNALPALIVQPDTQGATWNSKDRANLENKIRLQFKGLGNQFRSLVLERQAQLTQLDNPNLNNQYDLESGISIQVFEGMGVPQVLAGNASGTTFKDSDDTSKWFFFNTVLPEAREIEQYINVQLLPFFDPTGKTLFEFDTSAFDKITESDRLEAEVVNGQVEHTYLSLADAARLQERKVAAWMEDKYMVEGVPMTPIQINQLVEAKIAAAQRQPAFLSLPPALSIEADTVDSSSGADTPDIVQGEVVRSVADSTAADNHYNWLALYKGDELFPDETTIDGRMLDELEKWQRFAVSKFGKQARVFETTVLPPYIRHLAIDRLAACGSSHETRKAFDDILEDSSIRTIRTYQSGLRRLSRALWNESMSGGAFQSDMVSLINTEFENAFNAGFRRAGVPKAEMTSEDLDELDTLVSDEINHIAELRTAIEDNSKSKGGNIKPIRARVDRWVARYVGISEFAFVIAMRDAPLTWKWNPAKEHCSSCTKLNGKTYRASKWRSINIYPRSSKLECFGIFCGCGFFDAEGNALSRGRVPGLTGV